MLTTCTVYMYQALTLDEDGPWEKHTRFSTIPGMWDRTLTFSSSAKTFSVTGWKCGWVIGPAALIKNVYVREGRLSRALAA